jgi:PilZ domain
MHEIRSIVTEGPRSGKMLASKKGSGIKPSKGTGLANIAIVREEARTTNQRREDRHLNLAHRAVITFRRKRIEVDVVNVSAHGVMIEADIEPRVGERLDIRFEDCNRTQCCVRWVKGRQCGLEFAEETVLIASADVRELIVGGRRNGEQPRFEIKQERPPRQHIILMAVLHNGQESVDVRLHNISRSGAMLDCGQDFLVGTPVVLEFTGAAADAIEGRVRWCRSGQIGMLFDRPFDMRALVDPARDAERIVPSYMKPDYLATDGSPSSPWFARTQGLRPEDL